ncbi:MAG TPA: glycosyltransferase family 4 protein [Bryobacteraceae bacterium]|nr:glycosyltransferase family 4 protein [Bryobacteraceae bacterium]
MKMFDPGNFTPHYVENLSKALARLGIEVDLITSAPLFEEAGQPDSIGVENYFFKITGGARRDFLRRHATLRRIVKALGYPVGLWRTWRALRLQPPGILHVQWSLVPLLDTVLIRTLRAQGWRVVYTAHEVVSEIGRPLKRWQFGRIYREADAVVVHTPGLARKLRDWVGPGLGEVRVIPEGISTFPLAPDVDQKRAREVLGLQPGGPVLLFFGLLKPNKGLDYLLRAWRRVVEEFPEARLLIAGEVMLPLGSIAGLIRALKIGDSVTLRPGYVPQSEVQYLFCAADAVVLPYVRITTSSVVPLAYRFARPVIATSAGALHELVKDGETGFLTPPCAEEPLAEVVCRAFRDREFLADMGARARDWFEKERTWDQVALRTAALYRSLDRESSLAETAKA